MKEKLVEMLLDIYKMIFKTQTEMLKNKETINAVEEKILVDNDMLSKMETFMDQFLSTFQDVNFDVIVNLPPITNLKD